MLSPKNLHDYQQEAILHQLYLRDSMLWLQMGLGKEQPDSEPVLTPAGWQPIGYLLPGDKVIGSNGCPVEVLSVHPQGNKEVYEISFSDDTSVRCGLEHLWYVYSEYQRFKGLPGTVKSVKDLLEEGLDKKAGKNGKVFKWSIPLVAPVQYPQKDLPLDPYTLGVILGDGNVSENEGVSVCTDTSILIEIGASSIKPHESSAYTSYGYVQGLKQTMRDLGLMGKRSWEKNVPEIFLRSSVSDRLSLLQGLLDTDGSPIVKGGVEFCSTSEDLIDAVIDLTQSLGGVARNKTAKFTKHQGGIGRESWRVNVKLPSEFTPFRLKRKLVKWVRPAKYQPMRKITSIRSLGYNESSRCISVAADDKLYVTKNHVVTHNTPITLTVIDHRIRTGQVKKVLIFGPLRVIQSVWTREARKWEHTQHLRFSVLHGTKEKRLRALFVDADIYLINYENMNWLAEVLDHYYLSQDKPLPFQMCVYDEVSKMKNSTSLRFKGGIRDRVVKGQQQKTRIVGWRKILPHFQYRTGLTGTPASNGYMDLFGQYLAVDGGKRLGEYVIHFKDSYFESDYMGWVYKPTEIGKRIIENKISDITLKMDAADYLDMPSCKITDLWVDLPSKTRKIYEEIERNMFTVLESGAEIELFAKNTVSNKCLQCCNGAPYIDDKGVYETIHDAKLDALEEVLEEAAGRPVLCSYTFKSDAERIMRKFKNKYNPVNLTTAKASDTGKIVDKWNRGEIRLLIGHPASVGHGLDGLQDSGSIIVWFGLNWSLELYEQMNGRLNRQGQKKSVSIIRILCKETIDVAVMDAIERKVTDQNGLKASIQRYKEGKLK